MGRGGGGKGYSAPPPPTKLLPPPPPCSHAYVNGLLSSFVIIKRHVYYIKGASLLDRRGLIRVTSVIFCESQTTSQRACVNVIVYVDTREKVEITPFFPSDMMHSSFCDSQSSQGAQWLSGSVFDSRPKGRGFEPHRRHCVVSLSKNINPSLVLVKPRKTRPFITERLLMGRKESNQTNQTITK